MKKAAFETTLLPDGHLACPPEFAHRRGVSYKVIVTFDDPEELSDRQLELASVKDLSEDFLTDEEVEYYLGLDDQ